MSTNRTLVLGIGNTLLSDEGAGIHILNRLEALHPETDTLTYIDGGTLSFTLAVYIELCDNLIILDTAELHSPPGTVKTYINEDMDKFLGKTKRSPHEVGLIDLMDIARLTESLPSKRAIVGIQYEYIGWGMEPTPAVAAKLGDAVSEASQLITQWANTETVLHEEKGNDSSLSVSI